MTKLTHRGFDETTLARLHTPIGSPAVPGKRPIEVAVSIAAQIINLLHHKPAEQGKKALQQETTKKHIKDTVDDLR